ncbi:hypothetical protein BDN70DRAFT_897252 [Pholiota conissans]|uniref:Uncharacterized protein n=1 Tax=Pholiota conissans TaxID=109636 RepID=A0A9P6CRS6_9AGAR|nr:hypothetical protein BDN70DRAFT_897252 [Pholiota conissans]
MPVQTRSQQRRLHVPKTQEEQDYPSPISNSNSAPASATSRHHSPTKPPVPTEPLPDPWRADFLRDDGRRLWRYITALEKPARVISTGRDFEFPNICRIIRFGHMKEDGYVQPVNLWSSLDIVDPKDPEVHNHMSTHQPHFKFEVKWSKYPPWMVDLNQSLREEFPDIKVLTKPLLLKLLAYEYAKYAKYYYYHLYDTPDGLGRFIHDIPERLRFGPGGIDVFRFQLAYITMDGDQVWRAGKGLILAPSPIPQTTPWKRLDRI